MSEVGDLIKQVSEGTLSAEQAAPQIKAAINKSLINAPERPADGEEWADATFAAREADDNDYDNTFSEVVAAWIEGTLSAGQYHTIYEAVCSNAKSKAVPDEEPDSPEEETDV